MLIHYSCSDLNCTIFGRVSNMDWMIFFISLGAVAKLQPYRQIAIPEQCRKEQIIIFKKIIKKTSKAAGPFEKVLSYNNSHQENNNWQWVLIWGWSGFFFHSSLQNANVFESFGVVCLMLCLIMSWKLDLDKAIPNLCFYFLWRCCSQLNLLMVHGEELEEVCQIWRQLVFNAVIQGSILNLGTFATCLLHFPLWSFSVWKLQIKAIGAIKAFKKIHLPVCFRSFSC